MAQSCTCYDAPTPIAEPRTFRLNAGWAAIHALPAADLVTRRGILRHELDQLDAARQAATTDAECSRLIGQLHLRQKPYRCYAVELHERHQAAERAAQRQAVLA